MKEKIFSALRLLVFLALGVGLFWYVLRNEDLEQIKNSLLHANWWWAVLALVFGLVSNVFRSLRWNMLIHPLNYRPRFANTFCSVMVGYFFNLFVPRLGEVSRCAVLSVYEKIPVASLLGTVVVERIVDVISLLLLLLLLIGLEFDKMSGLSNQYILHPLETKLQSALGHGAIFYLITIGIVLLVVALLYLFYRYRHRMRFYRRLRELATSFTSGLKTIGRLERKGLFLLYSFLLWFCYFMMSYVCFNSFPATTGLGLVAGLAMLVFGAFGFVAPVPGGIGAFEFMVTTALAAYAVDEETSNAYAILTHASQTAAVLLFGALSLLALSIINKPAKNELQRNH